MPYNSAIDLLLIGTFVALAALLGLWAAVNRRK